LTIVGYSLNDTIVIFDRIRENKLSHKNKTFPDIINLSINESLSRTIITSFTTLLVVLALVLFGGEVLFGFSIAMVIGVIVGTYSSNFIASPILIMLEQRKRNKIKTKK
ncbi:MAG: protein translocase subunit SecF, partial [Candidatus Marinimicrobia bacterium]|nr:protein translocase subunit SecF [Candidatus Neomarinimicrobiota bacterium]